MHTEISGLNVEVFQHTSTPPRGAVILCHGFGAPGDDLVSLAAELVGRQASPQDVRFYFPAAPLSLETMGYGDSRAWWMIDMEGIAQLQRGDEKALRAFRELEPQGMPKVRSLLHAVVNEVANNTKLPVGKIVVGGFSQGAMLATDVALRLEEAPAGLAVLSGTLITEGVWKTKAAKRAGLPVFQSHGRSDAILPFMAAEWLRDMFTAAKMQVDFVAFDGGHTISGETVSRLATFIDRTLSTT